MSDNTLLCYNKGCGQKFSVLDNKEDSCRHHPGLPVFHDAYKGWSCCNKKCTDFTEFLNIKGCTVSKHSNEKPPEPVKPVVNNEEIDKIIEQKRAPIVKTRMRRPSIHSALTLVAPTISESLKNQLHTIVVPDKSSTDGLIEVGTICKNGGCQTAYQGPETDDTTCTHHPGTPVFHEGLKFWSCCNKRTTDFNAFLSQVGCSLGKHKWTKEVTDKTAVQCRWDWHQTATNVVIAIYAKEYNPADSVIQVNPIRLIVRLMFPKQNNSTFQLDMELFGIIDAEKTTAQMLGTKVEIKLVKAEPGTWTKVHFPRELAPAKDKPEAETETTDKADDSVDLNCIEAIGKVYVNEVQ
ncbi:cysteine and histidine-rich domain-containing protein [Ctenocephalides felis]|uniref:cysteine and histidine-rich domain-containing protein n=1 Tax=Ctenocephalides felis TaxID=7515 RepID=UPI000E6E335C|nr:cysteine and histidine-rich domain-containing protein [Ctenocephalides felis]